jgi:hypothetical protein
VTAHVGGRPRSRRWIGALDPLGATLQPWPRWIRSAWKGERRRPCRPPWKANEQLQESFGTVKSIRSEARCWLVLNLGSRVWLRSLRHVRHLMSCSVRSLQEPWRDGTRHRRVVGRVGGYTKCKVTKLLRFWQNRSPNYNCMGFPPCPLPNYLTGGSNVRGTMDPNWVEKFSEKLVLFNMDLQLSFWEFLYS